MSSLRKLYALLVGATLLLPAEGWATASEYPSEYQVKAVFLFNFSQFVEWPPAAFADAQAPFVIGVLGQDPFGAHLDEATRDEAVNGRPLVIRRARSVAELGDCQILFISQSEAPRLDEVIAQLAQRRMLTVSDVGGASQQGVMVRLVTDKSRVRLRINVEAARAAGLTISSKLLRVAELVTTSSR